MNKLTTSLMTPTGAIKITIGQFKTTYTYNGEDHKSYGSLSDAMKSEDPFFTDADSIAQNLSILRLEKQTLLSHYAQAVKPATTDDLISELSDRGVTVKSITIPCAGDNCDQVAIEDLDVYAPIAYIAAEAEYSCEFEDGLCITCHEQELQEQAGEEMARARHEAREESY